MEKYGTLHAVIQQLRELFLEKGELKGFDDWDKFLGCISAIERVADEINAENTQEETEG